MIRAVRFAAGVAAAGALAASGLVAAQQAAGPRIEVSFNRAARGEPVTGRVYVAISRTEKPTPIQQASPTGAPLFAMAADNLAPDSPVVFGPGVPGHPVASLRDLPAGEYFVQPFVNVYTKFARADGHTVWLHMDQWEGQDWKRSPGNLYGDPVKVRLDPSSSTAIKLVADKVIGPITPPADTDVVKRIRIQSAILTKWWGHPIYIGATVLLPKGFDQRPDVKYPIVYSQGHFSTGTPGGYGRDEAFTKYWNADGTPRVILATLQHPSPYYDDSYGVNSENNGPFGDAILQELIPAVESKFRAIGQPWARILTGGSTGGWIALAHQVFYPDFYGGTFALCPDSVDFTYHQIVNIYQDANAYWIERDWMRIERPNQRRPDGNIQSMMKDENWYELVQGDRSRSGGQWDIWQAVYSPVGPDGYPAPIWDKSTGIIDKKVAAYWKENYDLVAIMQRDWNKGLGKKLTGKIHIYVGEADNYYLNNAVYLAEDFLRTTDPYYGGEVDYGPRAEHCWNGDHQRPNAESRLRYHQMFAPAIVERIERSAPPGADLKSWRY
jgi:hypothetical protein